MTRPFQPSDDNARLMLSWLNPVWYGVAYSVMALLDSEGIEMTRFQRYIQQVLMARLPVPLRDAGGNITADVPRWALTRFEQELGLEVEPVGISDADRRARIMARFRGIGSTIFQLRQVARVWGYGDVAVIPGIENLQLFFQFYQYGIPTDLEGHEAEVRANVQAHLGPNHFVFLFTIWQELKTACNGGVLWCQLKTAGTTWDALRYTPATTFCSVECTPESLDPNNPLYP